MEDEVTAVEYSRGLAGVIVAESSICKIDGQAGELYYRGYPIAGLVEKTSFEEVIYPAFTRRSSHKE